MNTKAFSVQDLTKMALCVAFCCVTAYISFPLPFTPGMVTALTLALGVTAFVLPPKQTFLALLTYVLLGCIGLPVFVGGTAGVGRLVGPTGGYIIAWLVVYPIISALKGDRPSFKRYALVDIIVGIPLTYVGGLISMMLVMDIGLKAAIVIAVLPYIPGDIIKCLMAAFLGVKVNQAIERRR
ncbi:biotin transporter BioY [uncultured Mitsuokella sp.]|uniref:biotin transporter BioY n=1 Tax=uncultured Mitsuokella sp. TaxID=453120 RepID=UPI0025E3370D|nr:biotin transporter BioY [uncultured Mitsuokella sp.]